MGVSLGDSDGFLSPLWVPRSVLAGEVTYGPRSLSAPGSPARRLGSRTGTLTLWVVSRQFDQEVRGCHILFSDKYDLR